MATVGFESVLNGLKKNFVRPSQDEAMLKNYSKTPAHKKTKWFKLGQSNNLIRSNKPLVS